MRSPEGPASAPAVASWATARLRLRINAVGLAKTWALMRCRMWWSERHVSLMWPLGMRTSGPAVFGQCASIASATVAGDGMGDREQVFAEGAG